MKNHLILLVCLFAGFTVIRALPAYSQVYTVSGTITDPFAAPVDSVEFRLFDEFGEPIGIPPIFSDSFGNYAITNLPMGTYRIGFRPPFETVLVPLLEPDIVVAGDTLVSKVLASGHILSGTVRDTSGFAIYGVDLNVYDETTGNKLYTPGDNTDSLGFYDVVIPTGTFRLLWKKNPSVPTLVPAQAENVPITSDTTIDAVLLPGFHVTGNVKDTFGSPVVDADMSFFDAATGNEIATPSDNTDEGGLFHAIVPHGPLNIEVKPRVVDKLVAQKVPGVTVSIDTTMDFFLDPGFTISGTITNSSAVGVFFVDIDVKYAGVKLLTPEDKSDSSGVYGVIVPSGSLTVGYQPPTATRLAPVELAVVISADTVINVTVPDGILLSGLVQDVGSMGVPGVDIDAKDFVTGAGIPLFGDETDSNGVFTVVVVPGTYNIEIEPLKVTKLVAQRLEGLFFDDDTSIQITLDAGVAVTGTVTTSGGVPLANIDVDALLLPELQEVFTPADDTDTIGQYHIVIPPSRYHFYFRTTGGAVDSVVIGNVEVAGDTVINVIFVGGTVTGIKPGVIPVGSIVLHQNSPNPFNPSTAITFDLPARGPGGAVSLRRAGTPGTDVTRYHKGPGYPHR